MQLRNTAALLAGSLLLLTACSPSATPPAEAEKPHGYVEGAAELTEPQLTLATVDAAGELALLDLIEESVEPVGAIDGVTAVSTDGRFVFASGTAGVTVVDTGVWTVDHEDHSHYYRASPAVVGTLEGDGEAVVAGGGTVTAVTFEASGESVLLDSEALGEGEIVEVDRVEADLVVPFGAATLVASGGAVTVLDQSDTGIACADPRGTIATRVGVVIGCDDGAILATMAAETVGFEALPYPEAVAEAERATDFRGRPGRPTVAALAGASGFWLLDTRERTWALLPAESPLLLVAAADDTDGNVVALASDGRILTIDGATGSTRAATGPLLAATVADPALLAGVELTVDANRAYVNAPAEGVVYEIDYADGARVARTFETPNSPMFFAETGRLS
ncbi:lipoprotein [Conyzicola nivalis]|uniref:Lipoprotein n=1 Tax=Conyzicola nivalis TaxID=1477021 RepID=A0A916SKC4_9MICO|nr:hypothetical protein [Conyzicola nivalis]GGB04186.1 lipoprotein [Conyzicola nivalis]